MVRNSLSLFDNFNQLTPYAVGFDRIFDRLSDYASHQHNLLVSPLTISVKMVTIILKLKWPLLVSVKKI